jgi:hypothetical protein
MISSIAPKRCQLFSSFIIRFKRELIVYHSTNLTRFREVNLVGWIARADDESQTILRREMIVLNEIAIVLQEL